MPPETHEFEPWWEEKDLGAPSPEQREQARALEELRQQREAGLRQMEQARREAPIVEPILAAWKRDPRYESRDANARAECREDVRAAIDAALVAAGMRYWSAEYGVTLPIVPAK